jgi:hypothetical protein
MDPLLIGISLGIVGGFILITLIIWCRFIRRPVVVV